MRTLTSAIAIVVLGSAALSSTAYAGPYTASENVCQSAISERLGATVPASQYTLETVHNKMQYRDFDYVVSGADAKDVKVTCRVRKSGSLMALTFDSATPPVSVATQ